MTSSVQIGRKARMLESLGADYQSQGFTFEIEPSPDSLPAFMEGYRPDAVALAPGRNIAFDIGRGGAKPDERSVTEIRRRFVGHPDWRLHVVFLGADPLDALTIGRSARNAIQVRVRESRDLAAAGYDTAAFILSRALLEAAYRSPPRPDKEDRALPSGSVVQELAMHGRIAPETERRIRSLVELRNRVVHGDLDVDAAPEDVDAVLSAVEEVLGEDEASP